MAKELVVVPGVGEWVELVDEYGRTCLFNSPAWRYTLVRTWLLIFFLYAQEEEERGGGSRGRGEVPRKRGDFPALLRARVARGDPGCCVSVLRDVRWAFSWTLTSAGRATSFLSVVHFSEEDQLEFLALYFLAFLMDDSDELIPEWFGFGHRSRGSSSEHLSRGTVAVRGLAVTKCLEMFAEIPRRLTTTEVESTTAKMNWLLVLLVRTLRRSSMVIWNAVSFAQWSRSTSWWSFWFLRNAFATHSAARPRAPGCRAEPGRGRRSSGTCEVALFWAHRTFRRGGPRWPTPAGVGCPVEAGWRTVDWPQCGFF